MDTERERGRAPALDGSTPMKIVTWIAVGAIAGLLAPTEAAGPVA